MLLWGNLCVANRLSQHLTVSVLRPVAQSLSLFDFDKDKARIGREVNEAWPLARLGKFNKLQRDKTRVGKTRLELSNKC